MCRNIVIGVNCVCACCRGFGGSQILVLVRMQGECWHLQDSRLMVSCTNKDFLFNIYDNADNIIDPFLGFIYPLGTFLR
jgi:hypothetical protein